MKREQNKDWVALFYEKLAASGLVHGLEKCQMCGKCVANCPAAALSPSYNSRKIIRDVLFGNVGRLLPSEEIWQCFWCKNCYVSCPHDVDYILLVLALRFWALGSGYGRKYAAAFKRFATRLHQHGLSFVPGERRLQEIGKVRERLGLAPLALEEKALKELRAIFAATGADSFIEALGTGEEKPLKLTYEREER